MAPLFLGAPFLFPGSSRRSCAGGAAEEPDDEVLGTGTPCALAAPLPATLAPALIVTLLLAPLALLCLPAAGLPCPLPRRRVASGKFKEPLRRAETN